MTGFTFHIVKLNTIAALIICAACVVSRLTRKKYTCKWKYYIWLLTALTLLFPVNLSSFSKIQLQIAQPTQQMVMRQTSENGTAAVSRSGNAAASPIKATTDLRPDDAAAPVASASAPLILSLHPAHFSLYGFLQLFSCIWLTVFVLLAAFRILKYRFSLWSLRRWSSPVQNSDIVHLYRSICRREHILAPPRLMENRNLSTPVLAGLFHPALYLTEAPYDREELSFILRHELTHYKRKDLWFKLLLLAVSTIYWFNPALYLMRSEAEKDIENLCDGRVLQSSPAQSRLHYSRLLLKTAALQNHIPYLSASLNDSKLIFKERIHYLTELAGLRRGTPLCLIFCACLLTCNLALGSAVLPTQAQSSADLNADSDAASVASASVLKEIDARASVNAAKSPESSDASTAYADQVNGNGNLKGSSSDLYSTPSSSDTRGSDAASRDDNAAPALAQSPDTTGISDSITNGNSDNPNPDNPDSDNPNPNNLNPDNPNPDTQDPNPDHSNPAPDNPGSDIAPDTPVPGSNSTLPSLTDPHITLYALQDIGANYVWQSSDGIWYDGDYRIYIPNGDGTFTKADDQSQWTSEAPPSPADHASASVSLVSEDGLNVNQLYYDSDTGIWQNIAGGIYTSNGDGTFTGPNGDLWIVTS